eukprot:TRINITY_DN922_c1_g2_i2.p1 TRINITY_DN922_c1_g2~~TRINITY_DN922_c1_g2_i2.p1  ORF type:complete len:1114 (-),score=111.86 TRINITY_DN922_c1_g2_i2:238-3579(-)
MEAQKQLQLKEFDPFQQSSEHINKKQKTEQGWCRMVSGSTAGSQDKKGKIRRIGIQHPAKNFPISQKKQGITQQQQQQQPKQLTQFPPSTVLNLASNKQIQIYRQEKRTNTISREKESQQLRIPQKQIGFSKPTSKLQIQNLRDKQRSQVVNFDSVQKRGIVSQNCQISQNQSLKNVQRTKNVQAQNLRGKVSGQIDVQSKQKKAVQNSQIIPPAKNSAINMQKNVAQQLNVAQSVNTQKLVKESKQGKFQNIKMVEKTIFPCKTGKDLNQTKFQMSEQSIISQKMAKETKQNKILHQNEVEKLIIQQKLTKDLKFRNASIPNIVEKAAVPLQKSKEEKQTKVAVDIKTKQKQGDAQNSRKLVLGSVDLKSIQNQLKISSDKNAKTIQHCKGQQQNQKQSQLQNSVYRQVVGQISSQKVAKFTQISNQSTIFNQTRPVIQKKLTVIKPQDKKSIPTGGRAAESVKRLPQVAFQPTQKKVKITEIKSEQHKFVSQQNFKESFVKHDQKVVSKQENKKRLKLFPTDPFVELQTQPHKLQKINQDATIVPELQKFQPRKKVNVVRQNIQKTKSEKQIVAQHIKQAPLQVNTDKTPQIIFQGLQQPRDDKQFVQKTLKRKRESNNEIFSIPQERKQSVQRANKRPIWQTESDEKQLCSGNSQDSDQSQFLVKKQKFVVQNQIVQIKHPVVIPSTLSNIVPKIEIDNFCPSLSNFVMNREKDGELSQETQNKLLKLLEQGMSRSVDEIDLYINNRLSHSCVDVRFLKTRKGAFVLGIFSDDERVAHTVQPCPLPKFIKKDDGTFQWQSVEGWVLSFLTLQSVQKFKSLMVQWSERLLHQGGHIDVSTYHDEIPLLRVEKLKLIKMGVSFQRSKNYISQQFSSIFSDFHTPLYSLTDIDEMWLTRYNRCMQLAQEQQSDNSGVEYSKSLLKKVLDESIFERLIDAFEYVCCAIGHSNPLPLQAVQEIVTRFIQYKILPASISASVIKDVYLRWLKLREANDFRPLIPQYNRPVKHECDVVSSVRHDFDFIQKIIKNGKNHCSVGSGTGSNDQQGCCQEQFFNSVDVDIDNQLEGDRNSGSSRQSDTRGAGVGLRVRLVGNGIVGSNSGEYTPPLSQDQQ